MDSICILDLTLFGVAGNRSRKDSFEKQQHIHSARSTTNNPYCVWMKGEKNILETSFLPFNLKY